MSAAVFLPAPVPELLQRLKSDPHRVLDHAGKDIFIGRAPGRLDIMGGIADYTGSLVCEMPLDVAAAVAVQHRNDRKLVLRSYNADGGNGAPERTVELSLDDFYGTAALLPYETLQRLFAGQNRWAAYVAGVFPILAKYKKLTRRATGANIACFSTVPPGSGLASSAALECATLSALTAAYHLILEPLETAVLAQKVENHIVGAPCGVMDQVTSILGKQDRLLVLKCQPHELLDDLPIPAGTRFLGINSNARHSVESSAYRQTRIAAFMAQAIIARLYRDLSAKPNAKDPTNGYLANITPDLYHRYFRPLLPDTLRGDAFLAEYGPTIDRVTAVDPALTYRPRAAAEHHILEHARVGKFVELLKTTSASEAAPNPQSLVAAGQLMLQSHRSYSENAGLGSPETDLLVDLIMQRGPAQGFYGAKITGGGSGGSVAVLAQNTPATFESLTAICGQYRAQTGLEPALLMASSPGVAQTEPQRLAAKEL